MSVGLELAAYLRGFHGPVAAVLLLSPFPLPREGIQRDSNANHDQVGSSIQFDLDIICKLSDFRFHRGCTVMNDDFVFL